MIYRKAFKAAVLVGWLATSSPSDTVRAQDLQVLKGTVVDKNSRKPLRLVTISASGRTARGEELTDDDGVFNLKLVDSIKEGQQVRVRADKRGYVSADRWVTFSKGGLVRLELVPESKPPHPGPPAVSRRPAVFRVSDIIVDCYRRDLTCLLDFRVRNDGARSVSISRVALAVTRTSTVPTAAALNSSGNYDLDISNLKSKGDIAEVIVAHQIKGDDADRFSVRLTANALPAGMFRVWELAPTLITSTGPITAPKVTVGLPWDLAKSSARPESDDR